MYLDRITLTKTVLNGTGSEVYRMNERDPAAIAERLANLRMEHRALDEAIARLSEGSYLDQLQLTRLKKRKLQLKDMIARLESDLIPDLDA